MSISSYCYNIDLNKDYCQIFADRFTSTGWGIASITVISRTIVPYSMITNPIKNRAIEIASSHLMLQAYVPMTPTNYTELSTNFNAANAVNNSLYRGMMQTNKYIPNIWVQNIFKTNLASIEKSLDYKPTSTLNGVIGQAFGMTLFFTIGAIANVISDPINKLYYTGTLFAGVATIASQHCISKKSHVDKDTGSILLNFKDTALVSIGLIGSFVMFDKIKTYEFIIGNTKKSIAKYTSYIDDIYEQTIKDTSPTVIFTTTAFTIIASESYLGYTQDSLINTGIILVYPLAYAAGTTIVEITKDYSDFSLKNYIDFSGLIDIEDFDVI